MVGAYMCKDHVSSSYWTDSKVVDKCHLLAFDYVLFCEWKEGENKHIRGLEIGIVESICWKRIMYK